MKDVTRYSMFGAPGKPEQDFVLAAAYDELAAERQRVGEACVYQVERSAELHARVAELEGLLREYQIIIDKVIKDRSPHVFEAVNTLAFINNDIDTALADQQQQNKPCSVCGNEVRGQGGYLNCECPVQPARQVGGDEQQLAVWYGAMPESNGKSNWTAILHNGDITSGITLDRSEYPDRVRYKADRARFLIGELQDEPFILDYDADKHSGYVKPESAAIAPAAVAVAMPECDDPELHSPGSPNQISAIASNSMIDEITRLNRHPVPLELLERIATPCMGTDAEHLREGDLAELRAILEWGKP